MSVDFEVGKVMEHDTEFSGCSSCGCVFVVGEPMAIRGEIDSFDEFDMDTFSWVDTFCYDCIKYTYDRMNKLHTESLK